MSRTRDNTFKKFLFDEYVCGHHVYQHIWTPEEGETLNCAIEANNPHDKFAIGVYKAGQLVGHIPRPISRHCYKAIKLGAKITFKVNGTRCNRRHNGLEVPGQYLVSGRDGYLAFIFQMINDYITRRST